MGLTGGNVSVANAYVADVTAETDRSASFGKMAVAQNLGFVGGPAIAGLLGATLWGEIAPVTAALVVSAVALVVIATQLPESRPKLWVDRTNTQCVQKVLGQEQRDCYEVQGARRLGLVAVARLPNVGMLLAIHFLVYLAFNFFYVAFPVHAATGLGWQMRNVGFFFSYLSVLLVIRPGSGSPRRVETNVRQGTRQRGRHHPHVRLLPVCLRVDVDPGTQRSERGSGERLDVAVAAVAAFESGWAAGARGGPGDRWQLFGGGQHRRGDCRGRILRDPGGVRVPPGRTDHRGGVGRHRWSCRPTSALRQPETPAYEMLL